MIIRNQIIFTLFVFSLHLNAQYGGCNQYSLSVNQIFYPNSTTSYSFVSGVGPGPDVLYLCGPNTVVYDTLQPPCRQVLMENNTKYISNSQGCAYADFIYAKSTSTVVLRADGNPATFRVIYEPGATIIDLTGQALTFTCSALTFPNVNCSVGIKEFDLSTRLLNIISNPAQDVLDLEINFEYGTNTKIYIYNSVGQLLREEEITLRNRIAKIKTNDFQSGSYFITISDNVSHKISKRFVIAR